MLKTKRIGFHYLQDMNHFRNQDLSTWLPRLTAMGASWLVVNSPTDRAVPESFLKALIKAEIEPIIHFHFLPDQLPDKDDLHLLLMVYAKWGVKYIVIFNKPNLCRFWTAANWTKSDLVERFLDIYLPLAELCLEVNLIPIFPPLEPGGDYWDTAFLKASLQGIKRRGHSRLLKTMVIGAIARTFGRPLNWGAGGPERWPDSLPYRNPKRGENHLGFRIYDWYQALIKSCLVKPLPIFLFEVLPCAVENEDLEAHARNSMAIAQLMAGEALPVLEPVPSEVIGAAFWLLSAGQKEPDPMAWFRTDGSPLPIVEKIQAWNAEIGKDSQGHLLLAKKISHYLLLTGLENGGLEIAIDRLRPFIQKHKPTIGFSLDEARQAERVTLFDFSNTASNDTASQLRNAGCLVQQIDDVAQLLHL
jgi:hypothetical protein